MPDAGTQKRLAGAPRQLLAATAAENLDGDDLVRGSDAAGIHPTLGPAAEKVLQDNSRNLNVRVLVGQTRVVCQRRDVVAPKGDRLGLILGPQPRAVKF